MDNKYAKIWSTTSLSNLKIPNVNCKDFSESTPNLWNAPLEDKSKIYIYNSKLNQGTHHHWGDLEEKEEAPLSEAGDDLSLNEDDLKINDEHDIDYYSMRNNKDNSGIVNHNDMSLYKVLLTEPNTLDKNELFGTSFKYTQPIKDSSKPLNYSELDQKSNIKSKPSVNKQDNGLSDLNNLKIKL